MTDDTRSRILDVALDLFASRGYHTTSIREIAERLELTKTAVLYHFPSKKEIVAALAEPLLADMEAALAAAGRAPAGERRWALIEGLLDVWLAHRHLLRMQLRDLALASDGPVYERFRDAAIMAEHVIAGPLADHADRIRAVQAFAMLSDPVVMFADLPSEMLRPAVLAGVERLLQEPPKPRPTPRPATEPMPVTAPAPEATPRTAPGTAPGSAPEATSVTVSEGAPGTPRRRGRPGSMSPEAVERARRMHASGEHTAAEIARALGVSRATLYRHLSR
ncbi:TetR family transcriptional regulator [Nonomuraea phyllanthi]|uniref:TetR family transcriptional regulator n=1 Tax=Nonomuraea phyllanthi TaxID=2219224 RepID=A0A5C4VIK8_9ACTN|nr:TetR family transcriptional regulator [Nonomuraea phyllanthi]KAB8191085.1 TetR family transcriptional regulator [Nonomuraea phyllanthi]